MTEKDKRIKQAPVLKWLTYCALKASHMEARITAGEFDRVDEAVEQELASDPGWSPEIENEIDNYLEYESSGLREEGISFDEYRNMTPEEIVNAELPALERSDYDFDPLLRFETWLESKRQSYGDTDEFANSMLDILVADYSSEPTTDYNTSNPWQMPLAPMPTDRGIDLLKIIAFIESLGLTDLQGVCWLYHYWFAFDQAVIAKALDITQQAVSKHIAAAKKKVEKKLKANPQILSKIGCAIT